MFQTSNDEDNFPTYLTLPYLMEVVQDYTGMLVIGFLKVELEF